MGKTGPPGRTPTTEWTRPPKRRRTPDRSLVPPSNNRQKPWLTSAVGSASRLRSASEKRRPASGLTRRTSKKAPETTVSVAETGVDPPVIDWTLDEYAARPSRAWFWAAR